MNYNKERKQKKIKIKKQTLEVNQIFDYRKKSQQNKYKNIKKNH